MLAILANDSPTARSLSSGVSSTSSASSNAAPVHRGVQADESAEDALGGDAIELLMGDGARQCVKRRVFRVRDVRELARGANQIRKNRVDSRESAFERRELRPACTWKRGVHARILAERALTSGSAHTNRLNVVPA